MQDSPTKTGAHAVRGTAIVLSVAMLIVGGLIGFGITKAADNTKNMTAVVPTSATKARDLRANLVTLGVEHMSLTDQAVDAALDGSPNAQAFDTALNTNGTDIGAAVGSIYGASAQKTFDTVWQLHLDDFVKYAVADKQGDRTAKAAALADIDANYSKPLAQFLASANPNLPDSVLLSSLRDHVQMTAQMIDDHVQGNYTPKPVTLRWPTCTWKTCSAPWRLAS
ncbi:MAG: hypothetical protein WDN27_00675 [Candidatus Saccharibacteria bacterium]